MTHSKRFTTSIPCLVSLAAGLIAIPALRASDFVVQGTYAVHATIGPGLGSSIGIFNVDKNGVLNGYAILNLPAADGSRRTVRLDVTGTETVNPDGTGQAKYGGPLPGGVPAPPVTEDFVITKAKKQGRTKLALQIFDQREEPSVLLGTGIYESALPCQRNCEPFFFRSAFIRTHHQLPPA